MTNRPDLLLLDNIEKVVQKTEIAVPVNSELQPEYAKKIQVEQP
jgi:hypothetical protein